MKFYIILFLITIFLNNCIIQETLTTTERTNIFLLQKEKKINQTFFNKSNKLYGIILLYKTLEDNTIINIKLNDENKNLYEKNFSLNSIPSKYKTLKILFDKSLETKIKNYEIEIISNKNIYFFGDLKDIYLCGIYNINFKYIIKNFFKKFFRDKLFLVIYFLILFFFIACFIFKKTH
ncbi:MAG TPA: hypothetical protein PLD27_08400 [bacterium]|nr:hypothetical protein [bacterium]HOL48649.1 hypothetical protein [bacterium]HPQ19774.1 hypothetical protein [bacterium]